MLRGVGSSMEDAVGLKLCTGTAGGAPGGFGAAAWPRGAPGSGCILPRSLCQGWATGLTLARPASAQPVEVAGCSLLGAGLRETAFKQGNTCGGAPRDAGERPQTACMRALGRRRFRSQRQDACSQVCLQAPSLIYCAIWQVLFCKMEEPKQDPATAATQAPLSVQRSLWPRCPT